MKKLLSVLTVLALSVGTFAETGAVASANAQKETAAALAQKNEAATKSKSPLATDTCSFTFSSGTGNNFLKYCVTANGNITQFETPKGHEHIAVGTFGEGYGFCDFNSFIGYDDYAGFGDSGNWQNATVSSHSSTSVKIVRSTSDGIWTLTQTIAQTTGAGSAKLTMALKNNTAVDRTVQLLRYADLDVDNNFFNNFDGTVNSAFGWIPVGTSATEPAFGVLMQDVSTTSFEHNGFAQVVSSGPDPCNPFANWFPGTRVTIDGSVVMLYTIDIPAKATKTVSVSYKGM